MGGEEYSRSGSFCSLLNPEEYGIDVPSISRNSSSSSSIGFGTLQTLSFRPRATVLQTLSFLLLFVSGRSFSSFPTRSSTKHDLCWNMEGIALSKPDIRMSLLP